MGLAGPNCIFESLQSHSVFLAPFLARTHVNEVKNNPSPLLLSENPPQPPGWSRDPEHWRPVPSALQSVPIGSAEWGNSQNPLGASSLGTAFWSLDNGPTGLEKKGGEGREWGGGPAPATLGWLSSFWASLLLLQDLLLFLSVATVPFSKPESFPLMATSSPW